MVRIAAAAALAVVVAVSVQAGEYNKVVSVGDVAPTFTSLPGIDGKDHGLSDYKKDVVVVFITCNKCPEAIKYEDRIIALVKKYHSKVDFVGINCNTVEADSLPKMKERASEKGFNFSYLYDESQKIGHALGASVTPEFFVLDKNRKIIYTGAFDDNGDVKKVESHYLDDALSAALKGEKIAKTETRARGCGIGYERDSK